MMTSTHATSARLHPAPTPFVLAHATDLHTGGGVAFRHSVALAERLGATLYSLHAAQDPAAVNAMPDAHELLKAWRRTDPEVRALTHHRVVKPVDDDPLDSLLAALNDISPDMLVVATHQRNGLERLLYGSGAEALALNADVPTLFLPISEPGFVASATGDLVLNRVLLPVDNAETADEVLTVATDLLSQLGLEHLDLLLLHIGPERVLDHIKLPATAPAGWCLIKQYSNGPLTSQIAELADAHDVGLCVMGTRGHDGVEDILWGSHTEQTIRSAHCPVLSVPL